MTDVTPLPVTKRNEQGRGSARAARRAGRVPGVIYGGGGESESIYLDRNMLMHTIQRGGFTNKLFLLEGDGISQRALPREVQVDALSEIPLHVDFQRMGEGATARLTIPVDFIGHAGSLGLKRGGVLNIVRHEIEFFCPVDNIPAKIVIDLDGLDINDSVHIEDVELPEGVRPTIKRNFTVATIAAPSGGTSEEEEDGVDAEAEGAEDGDEAKKGEDDED